MATVTRPVTELKICFDPALISGILERIDNDPAVNPKGLAQISFYNEMITTLRYRGEMMDVTVQREMEVPDDAVTPVEQPSQANPVKDEVPVWTAEDGDVPAETDATVAEDHMESKNMES